MNRYKIEGGYELFGKIRVHGSKNAALPILAATIVNGGKSIIHNCPDLSDVSSSLEILKFLGCKVQRDGSDIFVDSSCLYERDIPPSAMCQTRGSTIFAGALLARCKRAFIAGSGGCCIGLRPIDLHLKAFREMGIDVSCTEMGVLCRGAQSADAEIVLSFPSVGATENIMLAASSYSGLTVIHGAAKEPEIQNLADYLRCIGVSIIGDGTEKIEITGTSHPCDAEIDIIPDRIVAATYACAVACSGGRVEVCRIAPSLLSPYLDALSSMGMSVDVAKDSFVVCKNHRCRSLPLVSTAPYPGFPTDCQPLIAAPLTTASGVSLVEERVFENRFGHCHRLAAMGADIDISGSTAVIKGVERLCGATVDACDLRCGAALTAAALGAEGFTYLAGACYIERGYENLFSDFTHLGAKIERIE